MRFLNREYDQLMDMFLCTYRIKPNRSSFPTNLPGKNALGKTVENIDLLGLQAYSSLDLVKVFISKVAVLFFFLTFTIFSSCEKDNKPQLPPNIQLVNQAGSISSNSTIPFGQLMTFTIKACGGSANLTNLYAIKSVPRQDGSRVLDTSMNIQGFTVNKSFTKTFNDTEYWTFIVRDKNLLFDSVSVTITRDTSSGFGPVRFLESVEMSAQNLTSPGSFFSFDLGVLD